MSLLVNSDGCAELYALQVMGIVGFLLLIYQAKMLWFSKAATIFDTNVTLLSVFYGQNTNPAWFINSMTISRMGQSFQLNSTCQLRLFLIGLQHAHDTILCHGDSRIIRPDAESIQCFYMTDKDHFVSSVKVSFVNLIVILIMSEGNLQHCWHCDIMPHVGERNKLW